MPGSSGQARPLNTRRTGVRLPEDVAIKLRKLAVKYPPTVLPRVVGVSADTLDRATSGAVVRQQSAERITRWVRSFEQPHPTEVVS